MNADKILFRASCIGNLISEKNMDIDKFKTAQNYLIECFIKEKYGREKEIESKFLEKGNIAEEDSITLFSRFSKKIWFKNEEKLTNEFISGTPDLIPVGEDIRKASQLIDLKTSWSIFTFFSASREEINKNYYWQLMAYMALTGAKKATLAYCLVNTPSHLIDDEKRRLMFKLHAATDNDPLYIAKAKELEKNMIFDLPKFQKDYPGYILLTDPKEWNLNIPMEESVITFEIERDEKDIQLMYDRVAQSRTWLNKQLFKVPVPQLQVA